MNINIEHSFSSKLINWYYKKNISFPWRRTKCVYSIWISEIMLQQTKISSVIPYYNAWLKKYPTIYDVANSSIDNILKSWEGLGYYNRAKNFYNACKIIITKYNGIIPNNKREFLTLPGVGPYTASAVMSIAHNIKTPAIDGNAIRVISRTNEIIENYPKSKNKIYSILLKHLSSCNPSDFNQAIMDLGRIICKPKNPSCYICPVSLHCQAYVHSTVDNFPIKIKPNVIPHYNVAIGIIWKNKKILISKRLKKSMLGGMWEFPGGKIKINETPKNCIKREVKEELNITVMPKNFIKKFNHRYSHFSITIKAFDCEFISGRPISLGCEEWKWINPKEVYSLAFPRANHNLFEYIQKKGQLDL